MDLLAWVLAAAALAAFVLIITWQFRGRGEAERADGDPSAPQVVERTAVPDAPPPAAGSEHYLDLPSSYVLVGAPVVLGDASGQHLQDGLAITLRDWLVHLHPDRSGAWTDVVRDFYATAAEDPVVGDYFHGVDVDGLQRHFLAALMILTGSGLTVGTYRRMQAKHAGVRNRDGRPITPEVFDAAIGVLVDILRGKGVPGGTLRQVEFVLAPLRTAIARTDPPAPSATAEKGD
jgi:truncated hemoglobin YjbI